MKDIPVGDSCYGDTRTTRRPISWDQPRPEQTSPTRNIRNIPASSSYTNDSSRAIWQRAVPAGLGEVTPAPSSPRRIRPIQAKGEDNPNQNRNIAYDVGDDAADDVGDDVGDDVDPRDSIPLTPPMTPPMSPSSHNAPYHIVLKRTKLPSPHSHPGGRHHMEEAQRLNDQPDQSRDCKLPDHAPKTFPEPLLLCRFICRKPRLAFGR